MVLNSPFTKTLYIYFLPLPLSSSLSELSEMLPTRLQSSFCPSKTSLTALKLYIFFFSRHGTLNIFWQFPPISKEICFVVLSVQPTALCREKSRKKMQSTRLQEHTHTRTVSHSLIKESQTQAGTIRESAQLRCKLNAVSHRVCPPKDSRHGREFQGNNNKGLAR